VGGSILPRGATGSLKLIVAIVRPERLDAVQQRLAEAQVFRLTVSDVRGIAPTSAQGAAAAYAAGGKPSAPPKPQRRVKLEVAVNEDFVEPTVRALTEAARSEGDEPAQGSVFVIPLEETIRIRTGERGPAAI
jgi:nitrogen regulatory protein P-II 2